jgi:hypothetical protein
MLQLFEMRSYKKKIGQMEHYFHLDFDDFHHTKGRHLSHVQRI